MASLLPDTKPPETGAADKYDHKAGNDEAKKRAVPIPVAHDGAGGRTRMIGYHNFIPLPQPHGRIAAHQTVINKKPGAPGTPGFPINYVNIGRTAQTDDPFRRGTQHGCPRRGPGRTNGGIAKIQRHNGHERRTEADKREVKRREDSVGPKRQGL